MTSSLLVLLLLSQAEQPATSMPSPLMAGEWSYLTRLEATGLALLPGGGVVGVEGYAQLTPMVVVVAEGEAFGLNLSAPVRLRLGGGEVGAGLVRSEDWDSLSDWGQLVHALKLGSDTAPVGLWVGALDGYSLLSGHLVRRYSNRANPDYHPAGASLTGTLGPLYLEAFASDVLGARLMGAQAEVDLEHLFTGPPQQRGRYTLGLSAVHDWGRAGGASPPVTLAHLDRLAAQLANRNLEVALSGLALGLGQPGARHLYSGQVRWRFGHKLYALAEGGTLLYPQPDGSLNPGAFASLGLGVDNAR